MELIWSQLMPYVKMMFILFEDLRMRSDVRMRYVWPLVLNTTKTKSY